MLLVVIAIGLMIYYADISWMGGDSRMIKGEKPKSSRGKRKFDPRCKSPC